MPTHMHAPHPGCPANVCPPEWISDDFCDSACNTEACGFDGGDCQADTSAPLPPSQGDARTYRTVRANQHPL